MSASAPAIHVLTGPTAVGKTENALRWAEQHDAEIISCDSVCVYRGMDIGSAKPTAEEQRRVRHHGLDLVESVFKRLAGAKDSGATIPGIGGALDLIDSMVLTSPVALILLSYFLDWAKRG